MAMLKNVKQFFLIIVISLVCAATGFKYTSGNSEPVESMAPSQPSDTNDAFLPADVGYDEPIQEDWIVIDHNSVDLFDEIPDEYITAARNLRLLFSDRSVGDNISSGLDCLAAPSWAESSPGCRRAYYDSNWNWRLFFQADLDAGIVPVAILFEPDPVKYSRSNWLPSSV